MPPAVIDHGQELTLRTRRGADLVFMLTVTSDGSTPIDITGATVVGRIFASGQPEVQISGTVSGPAGTIAIRVPATTTKQLPQDMQYVLGYSLAGIVRPLIFGAFQVSQDSV